VFERKKKVDPILNWHPNFRVVELLPDIKTVRTGFLVNFAAIFFALVALGWTVATEVEIHNVNRDIDRANGQIEDSAKANTKNMAGSKQFVTKSRSLQFAAKFFSEKVPPLDLLNDLLDARPDNIIFDSVEISPNLLEQGGKKVYMQRIILAGTLTDDTSKPLDAFAKKILAFPSLKGRIVDPEKNMKPEFKHDDAAGVFKFTITLNLKPTA